ncbi:MAG TPA: hypothetical protein VMG12_10075 [Polyangiaceae bacterium]|nr:hypothetical protein [Polyangiaceae bacterium]
MTDEVPEKHDPLWWVAVAPGVWAAHFLLSYATAAVWCAKRGSDAPLALARTAIAAFTLLGLVAVGAVALRGLRGYRRGGGEPRLDIDTSLARHQFMGFTLLSLAGLSAVAIVYQALAAVFIGSCR